MSGSSGFAVVTLLAALLAACSQTTPEATTPRDVATARPATTDGLPTVPPPKISSAPASPEPGLLEPVPATAEDRYCLAQTLYFEARGEPPAGQRAVAAVVFNRVRHPRFPDSICEVVRQGGERPLGRCQFSWWCDGHSDQPRPSAAWQRALRLAEQLTTRRQHGLQGALYFHNVRVAPSWSRRLERVARIGDHIYYR